MKWCRPCQINSFKNYTSISDNEKINNFIQEMQLKINKYYDVVFEWIPYSQFNDINEKNGFTNAIWKDGPLKFNCDRTKYEREHNIEVSLKYSQSIADEFLNEAKEYSIQYFSGDIRKIYGISQNSDTKEYIMVLESSDYCKRCDTSYINKWCKQCQTNSFKEKFTNWTSRNEQIDNFIQGKQLNIRVSSNIVFEWIPYEQFNDIKEVLVGNDFTTYLAIWKVGRLRFSKSETKYERDQNIEVTLKCFHNLQNKVDEFLNKVNLHHGKDNQDLYGISQYPITKDYIIVLGNGCYKCNKKYTEINHKWCKPCQINSFKENFANWTSGNKQIDEYIQELQLKTGNPLEIIFEWIPYNQFNDIKEINKNDFVTIHSAFWRDGPLIYNKDGYEYVRNQKNQNKKVILKCLHNKPEEFLNEVKAYPIKYSRTQIKYGISQNPNTKDYIMVLQDGYCEKCNQKCTDANYNWCKPCQIISLKENFINWSENENINGFIQEMRLKIDNPLDIIFELIPYNQFDDIKEINEDGFTKAMWKDGPLNFDKDKNEYKRSQNKEVTLRYLYNLQNAADEFLNEAVRAYSIKKHDNNIRKIYGISQNPDTKEYILILQYVKCEKCVKKKEWCKYCEIDFLKENFANWTSGNEIIDNFIQDMQLKVNSQTDIVVEWIPYDQFNDIDEISKNNIFIIYLSKWKDGTLVYLTDKNKYGRLQSNQDKQIILKCLHDSNNFLNEATKYSIKLNDNIRNIFGITQNPNTKEYFMILQYGLYCEKCYMYEIDKQSKWCKLCQIDFLKENFKNWTSGNEIIDNIIQEMQLKINSQTDIVVEWISYDQFDNIKEIVKYDIATTHSAIWKDGPLYYDNDQAKYIRNQGKNVFLKCLHNSQNIGNEFLNEVIKTYSIKVNDYIRNIYGITQNPDTKNYIIVLEANGYCEKCDKGYTYVIKWCKTCEIKYLKRNFTNWTSGNKIIDDFIQEMQLKVKSSFDIIFEWIPYNQLDDIKEINKDEFTDNTHSAIWKDGPLNYIEDKKIYTRDENEKVALKSLHNSQNITNEFLNEVIKTYSISKYGDDFPTIYGLSQNLDTKEYIMVLNDEYCKKCCKKYTDYPNWCKHCERNSLKENFVNWSSGNEIINNFIQEMQLKIDSCYDIIFEWIPYNQFDDIKEIVNNDFGIVYSAVWKDGPLNYDKDKMKYIKSQEDQNKIVTLKYLHDFLQNITDELIFKTYSIKKYNNGVRNIYGISQNPNTKEYIMILQDGYCEKCDKKYTDLKRKWCKPCQINSLQRVLLDGNEKVNNFILEMQLKIDSYDDIVVEWIPHNQFNAIKEISKNDFVTIHSAIWLSGQLHYNEYENKYTRSQERKNQVVTLKCLRNYKNVTDEFLNEAKECSIKTHDDIRKIYGISQNPSTQEYIMVLQDKYCEKCSKIYTDTINNWCKPCEINSLKEKFVNWSSENEIINSFIQTMQLKIDSYDDIVVEWIPYDQFNDIKEISKNDLVTIYSAIWMSSQLYYNKYENKYTRSQERKNQVVTLKCLRNSKNITDEFLNEAKECSIKIRDNIRKIYGITQNPSTQEYMIVLQNKYCKKCSTIYKDTINNWCKPCEVNSLKEKFVNWSSGNDIIDNFIQEMQLKIDSCHDIIFEWIPYNQFDDIKDIVKNDFPRECSVVWKDGPLDYNKYKVEYERSQNKKIVLKCLQNSQNISNEFLIEAIKPYTINNIAYVRSMYGISQNPDTREYIMVLQDGYCEKCNNSKQVNATCFWCKLSQASINEKSNLNSYKIDFDFTSTNGDSKKVKKPHIKKSKIKRNIPLTTDSKLIPYNQFNDIKEISKSGFATVHSAIWENGSKEMASKKVALKCLHYSQNIIDELLDKVKVYSVKNPYILDVYGITQKPDTGEYIIILKYVEGESFNNWMITNYKEFSWEYKMKLLYNITYGLKVIHQNQMVHHNFHTGNILIQNRNLSYISDIGLYKKVDNTATSAAGGVEVQIYGVVPYVAPEVLNGKNYTQASDIYSLGMIMYFIATGKQPFSNCAHDQNLALNICNGIRPEINDLEAPKCYIDLMKRCWDSNPVNRPKAAEVEELVTLFYYSYKYDKSHELDFKTIMKIEKKQEHYEIEKQFKKSEDYRKSNNLYTGKNPNAHSQAIYTSRLFNISQKIFQSDDDTKNFTFTFIKEIIKAVLKRLPQCDWPLIEIVLKDYNQLSKNGKQHEEI
ncbi:hypothetical protein RclHR1_04680007 [Rhizophagus clarus]|uniref:Protein kinase domain-containing protein n=1 Tax=Rhizophagus clarus TaxID=94130 RepID=A0A2Z6RIU4_9GLOM|nr:hypothetical protein RclHR1_04680007 [Rhizophagus clarus]